MTARALAKCCTFVVVGTLLQLSLPSAAEEVTFLATGVLTVKTGNDTVDTDYVPDHSLVFKSDLLIGDMWRTYTTFDTDTAATINTDGSLSFRGAVSRVRVIIGDDEFFYAAYPNLGSNMSSIGIGNNVPYGALPNYFRSYYAAGHSIVFDNGESGGCNWGIATITLGPIADPQLLGLSSEPPQLGLFSLPGNPAQASQSCSLSAVIEDEHENPIRHLDLWGTMMSLARVGGPVGSDIDGDGLVDVNDSCPADPLNDCVAGRSGAAVVSATTGGTVMTPDASVSVSAEAFDLASDATLSVTAVNASISTANLALSFIGSCSRRNHRRLRTRARRFAVQ